MFAKGYFYAPKRSILFKFAHFLVSDLDSLTTCFIIFTTGVLIRGRFTYKFYHKATLNRK